MADHPLLSGSDLSVLRVVSADRYWVLLELADLLEQAALKGPVLICLDDMQWADTGTVDAVRSLPIRLPDVPITWVVGFRAPHASSLLMRAVRDLKEHGATHVVLDPLDAEASRQVIGDLVPSAACSPRSSPAGGIAAASVAIDSAPFRGVLPLPISALRASSPVLRNPANHHRAVPLTYDQFRFAFANAVGEDEAHQFYDTFAVPASGTPLFQAATANLNPWTEAKADFENPQRGPMLIISGEKDNTSPRAINEAIYQHQARNESVTEFIEIPNRGHGLTIDSGWREVCDVALGFIQKFS